MRLTTGERTPRLNVRLLSTMHSPIIQACKYAMAGDFMVECVHCGLSGIQMKAATLGLLKDARRPCPVLLPADFPT
ncbi:hypothetical protein Moror_11784 [Moniliophthora roreri MCA 2997]|uniref:Uncharacterized protein n=1 Tax=Moniliophthora roreri (strain MCA 2997) TaxID=1381753 RepID=V2XU95_MONRO|nr:hypothetical protein Moror_11784 [Moniliophthora roreri MCA 2997]